MITQTNSEEPIAILNVEYAISRQPEPYNNVRAAISLPVFVKQSDDIEEQIIEAFNQARSYVQDEIDSQFESFDRPAPYSREPRFNLLHLGKYNTIVPNEVELADLPSNWSKAICDAANHRLAYLRKRYPQAIDCSGENYDRLPLLQVYNFLYNTNPQVSLVLWVKENPSEDRYTYLRENYPDYFYLQSSGYVTDAKALDELNNLIEDKVELTIIDLRDGDWSKLPPPPAAEPPSANEPSEAEYYEHDTDRW
jgi:hypothetical protein